MRARRSSPTPAAPRSAAVCVRPTETRADILLRETLAMLAPLVRLLIAEGITYPQLAQALKPAFLDAARAELAADGRRPTDSALSLRSGVHRKDVRAMARGEAEPEVPTRRSASMAAEVFGRWTNDPRWLDRQGRPLDLPLRATAGAVDGPTFESLAASVSKDVHARSLLEELVRRGVVDVRDDVVRVNTRSFVPQERFAEMVRYLARNVGDHLATAATNVRRMRTPDAAPLLEHSLSADGLSAASAAALHERARALWDAAFRDMFAEASARHAGDAAASPAANDAPRQRVRFGAYFHVAPEPGADGERAVARSGPHPAP